nr:MAG TPA: hypothetical protein [Caudoviricetes sp.]
MSNYSAAIYAMGYFFVLSYNFYIVWFMTIDAIISSYRTM